jgi:hypothetical protein
MTKTSWLWTAAPLAATVGLAVACGGGDGAKSDGGAGAPDGSGPDAVVSEIIPDPGTVEAGEWTDQEPNDTPGQATPVGIMNGPVWAGFVEPYTTIQSVTDVDWFVFRTKDQASLVNDYVQFCWGGAVNLLDLYLYEVVDQHQGPLVRSAESTDTSCETIVGAGEGDTILTADTTYLLEVRAAPGLAPGAVPAMYGA